MSLGGAGGGPRVPVLPPDRGSFPLDHEHQCTKVVAEYMACVKRAGAATSAERRRMAATNTRDVPRARTNCRELSKAYLECRMENGLMQREKMERLGFEAEVVATSSSSLGKSSLAKGKVAIRVAEGE